MIIKLHELPNYEFQFTNNNLKYNVQLNSRNGNTYLSYSVNNVQKVYNRVCLNGVLIDDLFIFSSEDKIDPYYTNFSKFELRALV